MTNFQGDNISSHLNECGELWVNDTEIEKIYEGKPYEVWSTKKGKRNKLIKKYYRYSEAYFSELPPNQQIYFIFKGEYLLMSRREAKANV